MLVWTLYVVITFMNGTITVYTAEFNTPDACYAVAKNFDTAICMYETEI